MKRRVRKPARKASAVKILAIKKAVRKTVEKHRMSKEIWIRALCTSQSRREGRAHAQELGLPRNYTVIGLNRPMKNAKQGTLVLNTIFNYPAMTVDTGVIVDCSPSVPSSWKTWRYGYIVRIDDETPIDGPFYTGENTQIWLKGKCPRESGTRVDVSTARNERRVLRAVIRKSVATTLQKHRGVKGQF